MNQHQFNVGDVVILGKHTAFKADGSPGNGLNWSGDMDRYVGTQATIVDRIPSPDRGGHTLYKVSTNQWAWRGTNMTLVNAIASAPKTTTASGASCKKCREFNSYAEASDQFVCYRCRH